jgi:hypothetical protein
MNRPSVPALLALLLLAPALSAQPLFFGDAVPQTHTRYGAAGAEPRLVSNGSDIFLFWATESKLRVTRLVDGQKRAGRPILGGNIDGFDTVWTGTHFLVVAEEPGLDGFRQLRGRLLNVHGEPLSAPFTIVPRGDSPSLAFDGARVLLTYGTGSGVGSVLLRPDGAQATDPHHQTIAVPLPLESVVTNGATGFVGVTAYASSVLITRFLPTSEIDDAMELGMPPAAQRRVAAANNGQDVLAVWTNGNGPAQWLTVRPSGTISARRTLPGTEGAVDVAASWNGTRWVVSVVANGRLVSRLIDGGDSSEAHAPVRAHEASPVSVASLGGRTLAVWCGTGAGQPVLVRDLAGTGSGVDVAFAAAEQTFQTATWSHEAALAVWSEVRDGKRTLHAGARTADGGWRENRIGSDEEAPLASSDGASFLVIKKDGNAWSAVTLSATMQVLASTPVIRTFMPTGIAWDGAGWVVIGLSGNSKIYVARVMPWGDVSTPLLLEQAASGHALENPRIAEGGGGFLAVWQDSETVMCFPVCDPYSSELRGARVRQNLQRVDVLHLEIAPDEAVSPDVYWDGNRFVVFWLDEGVVETRTIRPDAAGSGTTRIAGAQIDSGKLRATLTPFGAAITSDDGEMLLIRNNDLVHRYTLGTANSPDALVNLGPGVAYLQAFVRDEMPYHGASHLFLRSGGVIPRDTLPLAPQIVRASMTDGGNLITLAWTPPIDTIHGYRIEYRVDDGTWNELDEWIDADTTTMSIVPWLDKVKYQFRIRAWSDAGVSEYSMPATVRLLGRRRAVR